VGLVEAFRLYFVSCFRLTFGEVGFWFEMEMNFRVNLVGNSGAAWALFCLISFVDVEIVACETSVVGAST